MGYKPLRVRDAFKGYSTSRAIVPGILHTHAPSHRLQNSSDQLSTTRSSFSARIPEDWAVTFLDAHHQSAPSLPRPPDLFLEMAQRRLSSNNRLTERPRRLSIDLHLTQRTPVPANGRRDGVYSDGLDSPGHSTLGSHSTPTTPNGHPLTANPFQNLLTPRRSQPTPLPVVKILPLCIARVAEGLIFAVIFRECAFKRASDSSLH